ncbi:MAG: hypothetical protein ACE10A_06860 [Acidiferrobacterales bacterium]
MDSIYSCSSHVNKLERIVDDKLYLNYSLGVRSRWAKNIPGHIDAANENWPEVLN